MAPPPEAGRHRRPLLGSAAALGLVVACSKSVNTFLPAAPQKAPQVHVPEVVSAAPATEVTQKTAAGATDAHRSWTKTGSSPSSFAMLGALPVLGFAQKALASKKDRAALLPRANGGGDGVMKAESGPVVPVLVAMVGWFALMHAIQVGAVAVPFIDPANAVYAPIVATFVFGYLFITLEEQVEVNKAATALVLGISTWALVGTGLNLSPTEFETDIKESLEDVSEVVFFLLGALTIVEIMDSLKGFEVITKAITATNARELMVIICVLTFFLSSVLNNLTVVIVMISLLQKVVKDVDFRMKLGGLVVVTSNAGGAWTPIGDITTTMMYIGGQVTTVPLIGNLVFPSILCLIGTVAFEYFQVPADKEIERPAVDSEEEAPEGSGLVFTLGLAGMISVPVFTAVTQCPPWCGMMFVLGVLGVITSLLPTGNMKKFNLPGALARVEVPDCLFFLGILFAVGALERIGLLKSFAGILQSVVPQDELVATLLGFSSAIVDNVPLVAASQGMYDLTAHPANSYLWNLICYCAATGGSLLVIGSAAGIAFMGMEKGVSFGWYLKNTAPAALVGYFCGIAGIIAQNAVGLSLS